MKNIFAISFLVLSFNVFANSDEGTLVHIPYPETQQSYYGGFSDIDEELKTELTAKAIAICGTKENIRAVANVEVKVAFDGINIHKETFEGGYPLASLTAEVFCKKQ